jgi:carbamoyltransferase
MKILTIPILMHDSSITILDEGKITSYKMEERFSRKKHDFYYEKVLNSLHETKNNYFDYIFIIKHVMEEYTHPLKSILELLKKISYKKLLIFDDTHHLYHTYCGFYNSKFDEALCFSIDGAGAVLSGNNLELESIYYLNKKLEEKEIFKRTRKFRVYFEDNHILEHYKRIKYEDQTVGEKFGLYSYKIDYDLLNGPGKVMGLAQYKNHKEKLQYPYNTKEWKERVDGAYELQQETQNHVLKLIQKYTEETGVRNVVISGGYGLNCVANYHYLKNLKDINLYIDPICFDAGISIGAAYYHYVESTQNNPPIQSLQNAYIGYEEETYDLSNLETQKVSYGDIVNLLLQKNIVALFQGKSEAGQRALGNRSLLFDARVSNGKDLVNQIKRRENFRPFAGSILLEEASKWFNILSLQESPYMQYAVDAYENAIEQVPAIIHADNTCRIQTVTQEQNLHFYSLISCFFEKTDVPMLLNTSFNLGGEPLVETFNHAVYTLKNSMIEYLYLPEIETLVTIKNKNLMYQ